MKILLAMGLIGLSLVGCAKPQENSVKTETQVEEKLPRWEVITIKDEINDKVVIASNCFMLPPFGYVDNIL